MNKKNKLKCVLVLVLLTVFVFVSRLNKEKFGSIESKKNRLEVLRREIKSRKNPPIDKKYIPKSTSLLFPFREDWFFTL